MTKRLTIRLNDLAEPLTAAAQAARLPEAEYARLAIAEKLQVDAPTMRAGNPDPASANASRWAKDRWQRIARAWKQLPASQQSNIVLDYCGESAVDGDRQRLAQLKRAWSGLHRNQQAECVERVEGMSL